MPVEPIIVSYSELDTYRQCPLKHHILYGQRWTKPPKEDSALAKGSLYHAVMEEHMRTIKEFQDANSGKNPREGSTAYRQLMSLIEERIMHLLWDDSRGEWRTTNSELIRWMWDGWVAFHGLNDDWRIVGIEHQIITPLRDERNRRTRYHLKAKLDLIVRQRSSGGLWVVDHKSGANLPTYMDLDIDDQFGLYTWAMREVGKRVIGSIHAANRTQRNQADYPDYVGKSKPQDLTQRLALTYLNRDEQELRNLALDAYKVAWNAHPPKGSGPKGYSSPDPRSCGWKCDIKEPHMLMRRGRKPAEVLTEYGFKIDRTRH